MQTVELASSKDPDKAAYNELPHSDLCSLPSNKLI